MYGTKPKPTALKLVTGNPGRRPLNDREAMPPSVIPEPPKLLAGEALREWRRVTPLLAEVGLIALLDRAIVASYCTAYARWVEAEKVLVKEGLIVKAPSGYPIFSPYLAIANRAMDQVRQMAEQIGMSGSARSRIKAADTSKPDTGEAFLRRRG